MLQLRNDITLERFWELMKGCYKSLEIRCIAEQTQGTWRNIMFGCYVTGEQPEITEQRAGQDYDSLRHLGLDEIDELGLFHVVLNSEDIPQLANQFQSGRITLGDRIVQFREGYSVSTLNWVYSGAFPSPSDFTDYPTVFFSVNSRVGASSSGQLYNDLIEHGIRTGVDELGGRWLGITPISARQLNGQMFFPLYLGPIEVTFSADTLSMKVKAHKEIASHLRFSVSLRGKAQSGGECDFEEYARQLC